MLCKHSLTYIYILLMFTMPYLFVTSENLVTYFILYIEACKICLVNSIFNSSCWFYNMYWKWNCFDVVAKEKKCLRKTLLYQQFRSMNKRNSSVWTIVCNHYFSFSIFHFSFANCLFFISCFVVLSNPDQTGMDEHYICSSGKRQLWKQGFLTVTMSK